MRWPRREKDDEPWEDQEYWDELHRQPDIQADLDEMVKPGAVPLVWDPPPENVWEDLRRARETWLGMPYELPEYVCPWCPTICTGGGALMAHIEQAHPLEWAGLDLG